MAVSSTAPIASSGLSGAPSFLVISTSSGRHRRSSLSIHASTPRTSRKSSPTIASQASGSPNDGTGAFHQSGCSFLNICRRATSRGQRGQFLGASSRNFNNLGGALNEVNDYVAATSVGIVAGMPLLDLAYEEDSTAEVDMNIVKTGDGRFIEIQGTAEAEPFGTDTLTGLLALADKGIQDLIARQREITEPILGR